eukprot:TRINITY_DN59471_c0_g1_i1.p1 TRINITY_DN59471_c0_g1~~TRINITY_DN59471_c0_g1_i1.p1  ORF type:complete len:514 (-),score=82.67 TRINITY_DN59471_c0_g1_i1:41-1582(-)
MLAVFPGPQVRPASSSPQQLHRHGPCSLHAENNKVFCQAVVGGLLVAGVRKGFLAAASTLRLRRGLRHQPAAAARSGRSLLTSSTFLAAVAERSEPAAAKHTSTELTYLLLGGAGRIGTAAAVHLLKRSPIGAAKVILVGRNEARGNDAIAEILSETEATREQLRFEKLDWLQRGELTNLLNSLKVDAVVHTAGPFDSDMAAGVLEEVIAAAVPVYVDVADPVEYLSAAKKMTAAAAEAGTMALVSAGAFPGFSNVLAKECSRRLRQQGADPAAIKDVNFSYFTAGLGGSGPVNLLITNLGFGEPVPVFKDGKYAPQMTAGAEPRNVEFFLDSSDPAFSAVGEREVWSWPFPEAKTVAEHLRISGSSSTGMGTAPGIWNTILRALVAAVPRDLWQERWFSEGLAWFSLPMVWVTDQFVKETHAMRVDVLAEDGRKCAAVQAHTSFRRCVAQSAAEFTMELLERRSATRNAEEDTLYRQWQPGVWLPEELPDDGTLLRKLSGTQGTISCGFKLL